MRQWVYLCFCLQLLTTACAHRQKAAPPKVCAYDLTQMKDSGELTMLTLYSSTSYFMYRGESMGYQYELASLFAKTLGVQLKVKVAKSVNELTQLLQEGKGDFIAYPLPITKNRKEEINFCSNTFITHQVLVQRNSLHPIKEVTQLIGKTIYVKPGKYAQRLHNLNNEIGGGIKIEEITNDSVSLEDLITQVAKKKINYTIADEPVARLNRTYYKWLHVKTPVSLEQRSAWAVRQNTPELEDAINTWFTQTKKTQAYKSKNKRYFERSKALPYTLILSVKEGKISHFDAIFKKYAKTIGWDWRKLASLAFTESNFDTTVVSWAGARGLMQLMPGTARAMGVPDGKAHNPEESVKAACKFLSITERSLREIPDANERSNFVLGAYNAGLGHVLDAIALARKYGKNPYVWHNNAENFILHKSQEKYYNDSVCKYGYLRGVETYTFVREINKRYEMYKAKIKE